MIKWFEKIKDSDNIFINNIINNSNFKYYNSIEDINILNNNKEYIFFTYPFKNNINKISKYINKMETENINIVLDIDNNFISSIDKFAKKIIKLKKHCINFNNLYFCFVISENINTDDNTIDNICNIYHLIIALKKSSKKEMYEYIYDVCCDYLDYLFSKNNYCDFKNDKCIANRENKTCHLDNGCCYHVTFTKTLSFKNDGLCPYQKDKKCQIKCLPCKLFVCKHYRKMGVNYTPNNVFLLKHIFNKKQKLVLKYNIYTDKDLIIEKLLEKNYMPYVIYYLTWSYYINSPK